MLWICLECTTAYSVGADGCPHCGSHDYAEEGTEMAKISRHGGPSNRNLPAGDGLVVDESTTTSTTGGVEVVLELPDGPVDVSEHVLEDDAPDGPYAGMLRADLQLLLAGRGLPTTGNKAELVARLIADDEAKRGEVDGELGTVPVDPA